MKKPISLFDSFPILETSRLILRQVRPSDAEAVFAIFSAPEVTRYYDQPTFQEMAEAEDLIERMRQRFSDQQTVRWGITRRGQDTILGTCGYADWKPHFKCASIGYELNRAYWRQGIMSEAITAVLAFGFGQMNLNRIEAYVMTGNEASTALLTPFGFVEEGVLREFGYWKRAFHDLHLFSLLKRDYFST